MLLLGRVIAIASGKGGVGKTTLTANIGIALAKMNQKVLMVDGDVAMANLSLLLGMHSSPITLHDVLLGESVVQDAIYDAPLGSKFIPSGLSLENYRRVDQERLEGIITSITAEYDFVLIDAPPGIEKGVLSALSASDEILLLTTPDTAAMSDVLKTKIIAQRLGVKVIGFVINMVRGEKGEISKDDLMTVLELPCYGIVPYDIEVRKSFMQEKVSPVIMRSPNSPASAAITKIAAKIAGVSTEGIQKQSIITMLLNKLLSIFKKKTK